MQDQNNPKFENTERNVGEVSAHAKKISSCRSTVRWGAVAAAVLLAVMLIVLPGCGKGVVFLNGFTLGRFWHIGPQKRLYIPAPLLKMGKNFLRIVETEGAFGQACLMDEPDLG